MISDKLKNALNKLPPHLGNLHLGSILKNMSDTVDASAAAVEGLTAYSEAPVRIGTWIDGTLPVWRVVLPYIKMKNEVRHLVTDQKNNDVYVSIAVLLSDYITEFGEVEDDVVIVDNKIYGVSEYQSYQIRPTVRNGLIHFSESSDDYDDLITHENGSWGGVIDFTCPEENIQTGDAS